MQGSAGMGDKAGVLEGRDKKARMGRTARVKRRGLADEVWLRVVPALFGS